MKIQSGWAVDTNLIARLRFYETFVDKNLANENYYFSWVWLNIWLTVYLQLLQQQFSKVTAGIFPHCKKRNVIPEKSKKLCYPESNPRWLGTVPTHQLAENAALGAIQSCAGLSALPAAAESQLWISPVSFVNILDLFQHELNTNPVIQLGQLLPPGHTLKQTCYVRTCFRLHVSRKSRGIRERIFRLCIQSSLLVAQVPLKYAWRQ